MNKKDLPLDLPAKRIETMAANQRSGISRAFKNQYLLIFKRD